MKDGKLILALLIMASVTYAIRLLPLTFFRRKIKKPYIRSFLNFVPFAVLGAMTFPDVFSAGGNTLSSLLGVITAFALSYLGKGLLTVSLASCAVIYLVNLF